MITLLQSIIIVIASFAILIALLRLREQKIPPLGFIAWSLIWIGGVVIAFLPNLAQHISNYVGIGRGIDLVVYFSIALLLYLSFRLHIKLEDTERRITQIVREIALKRK